MIVIKTRNADSQDRVSQYFRDKFHGYTDDMPETLQRFTELLGCEKEEDGAGLKAAKAIKAELKHKKDSITEFKNVSHLMLPDLNKYLFSSKLNPPIRDKVYQDMNAPLSHYFIHTSLKSYFTGNHVFDKYSDEPIIDALKQGVRVVELDLWPCGRDGICVRHRWYRDNAFEKSLMLQTCLDSIKDNAFSHTTTYPVVITFKDSLKPDLQSKATQMINETFDHDMVYHHDPNSLGKFPSPEELRKKILISRRPPKEFLYANDNDEKVTTRKESVDENYRSLVAFHAVEPSGMLRKALTNKAIIQRPGWYETEVISFTQTSFLRTRPKSKFATYKPQRAWMHGAQMIALSRQEDKEKLWLMQGMFRANGGCGYVKKPDFLLSDSLSGVFYPTKVDPEVVKTLKVKVYMGDGWRVDFKKPTIISLLSKPNLYVMISIAGVPNDEKSTKTSVENNKWIPTWGEEFTFPLTYTHLALLSIQVYDHDNVSTTDGFAGQTCLPVSELIEGIRAVPLYDEKGEQCGSRFLLMRFKWS